MNLTGGKTNSNSDSAEKRGPALEMAEYQSINVLLCPIDSDGCQDDEWSEGEEEDPDDPVRAAEAELHWGTEKALDRLIETHPLVECMYGYFEDLYHDGGSDARAGAACLADVFNGLGHYLAEDKYITEKRGESHAMPSAGEIRIMVDWQLAQLSESGTWTDEAESAAICWQQFQENNEEVFL